MWTAKEKIETAKGNEVRSIGRRIQVFQQHVQLVSAIATAR